jgi:hypothetical protein
VQRRASLSAERVVLVADRHRAASPAAGGNSGGWRRAWRRARPEGRRRPRGRWRGAHTPAPAVSRASPEARPPCPTERRRRCPSRRVVGGGLRQI